MISSGCIDSNLQLFNWADLIEQYLQLQVHHVAIWMIVQSSSSAEGQKSISIFLL
jgi:hypothetical protein